MQRGKLRGNHIFDFFDEAACELLLPPKCQTGQEGGRCGLRLHREAKTAAQMKHRQHCLRWMLLDNQTAVIEFSDDAIDGNRLNFLNLRRFNAKSKRFDAENRDVLNIQGIHKKTGAASVMPTLRLYIVQELFRQRAFNAFDEIIHRQ